MLTVFFFFFKVMHSLLHNEHLNTDVAFTADTGIFQKIPN